MENLESLRRFWQRKNVLVTGHTGFKGGWLTVVLDELGARVTGASLPPSYEPSMMTLLPLAQLCDSRTNCDIREAGPISEIMKDVRPEIVLHLAAQPIVRVSYDEPLDSFQTNVMGTAHVLEACRNVSGVRSIVVVTTDKVYENLETLRPYAETDRLGGHDPYSASKAASEIVTASYARSFFKSSIAPSTGIATARAGNVIGGGDWSPDRLIPDFVRAAQRGGSLTIRHPEAVRPWQHVLEPLVGYLQLAQRLFENPRNATSAYNFGPRESDCVSVEVLLRSFGRSWKGIAPGIDWKVDPKSPKEMKLLTLDASLAEKDLGWAPRWNLEAALEKTADWYACVLESPANAVNETRLQIRQYLSQ